MNWGMLHINAQTIYIYIYIASKRNGFFKYLKLNMYSFSALKYPVNIKKIRTHIITITRIK